ncbi:MAG: hypothetical protein Q9190_002645, partial [Brigantiaea leucoxantha]
MSFFSPEPKPEPDPCTSPLECWLELLGLIILIISYFYLYFTLLCGAYVLYSWTASALGLINLDEHIERIINEEEREKAEQIEREQEAERRR